MLERVFDVGMAVALPDDFSVDEQAIRSAIDVSEQPPVLIRPLLPVSQVYRLSEQQVAREG